MGRGAPRRLFSDSARPFPPFNFFPGPSHSAGFSRIPVSLLLWKLRVSAPTAKASFHFHNARQYWPAPLPANTGRKGIF
ncbi:MAG TPA: hypothetical protein DCM58_07515 [Desulfovibrio sp.]|nr:hypothetical protein [Desulfovibrio sp.]